MLEEILDDAMQVVTSTIQQAVAYIQAPSYVVSDLSNIKIFVESKPRPNPFQSFMYGNVIQIETTRNFRMTNHQGDYADIVFGDNQMFRVNVVRVDVADLAAVCQETENISFARQPTIYFDVDTKEYLLDQFDVVSQNGKPWPADTSEYMQMPPFLPGCQTVYDGNPNNAK